MHCKPGVCSLPRPWPTGVLAVWLVLALPAPGAAAYELRERWHLEALFNMPESAVIDAARGYVYVSNVNTYARDSNGFLSRISLDGSRWTLDWVTGLHSPTGMALANGRLYVADVDSLVEVDLDNARVSNRYMAPDPQSVLNDVTVAASGEVFVSGSASHSIYHLEDGGLRLWRRDATLLQAVNGLLAEDFTLVAGGASWQVFDLASRERLTDRVYPPAEVQGIDGITPDGCGGYLFTLVDDPRIHRITRGGDTHALSELAYGGIDLHLVGTTLAVPRVGGSLTLFEVDTDNCTPE